MCFENGCFCHCIPPTHPHPHMPAQKSAWQPSISCAGIALFDVSSLTVHSIPLHRGKHYFTQGAGKCLDNPEEQSFPMVLFPLRNNTLHHPVPILPRPPSLSPSTSFLPRVKESDGPDQYRLVCKKLRSEKWRGNKHLRMLSRGFDSDRHGVMPVAL